jgi:hypothetical protein
MFKFAISERARVSTSASTALQFPPFVLLILVFDGLQPQHWTAMISIWEEAGSRGVAAPLSTTKSTRSKATSLWPNSSDSRHSVPFAATSSGNESRRHDRGHLRARVSFCHSFDLFVFRRGFGKQGYQCQSKCNWLIRSWPFIQVENMSQRCNDSINQ